MIHMSGNLSRCLLHLINTGTILVIHTTWVLLAHHFTQVLDSFDLSLKLHSIRLWVCKIYEEMVETETKKSEVICVIPTQLVHDSSLVDVLCCVSNFVKWSELRHMLCLMSKGWWTNLNKTFNLIFYPSWQSAMVSMITAAKHPHITS